MRPNLTVGILAEQKSDWERRSPLTPADAAWLVEREIRVEVETSSSRIFPDSAFKAKGAEIVPKLKNASLVVGIKEPQIQSLKPESIYMVFSHTAKGQDHNQALLRAFLKNRITLLDYEYVVSRAGERLVYFSHFAGICGMIDALHCLGKRLQALGLPCALGEIKASQEYGNLSKAMQSLKTIHTKIQSQGLPNAISPLIIGITSYGNVSKGAQEVLEIFSPEEIHPRDLPKSYPERQAMGPSVYKIVFDREEKFRSKDGKSFYFEHYLKSPDRFESNLDIYLPYLSMLIHTGYWDERFPRLLTEAMLINAAKQKEQTRLKFIGDLSCDLNGAIEITRHATNQDQPAFFYDPETRQIHNDWAKPGVGVMAIDNLPCELPVESSEEFGEQIRDYVYQIASHGSTDLTIHHALPRELRQAVITQSGQLTQAFQYLKQYC